MSFDASIAAGATFEDILGSASQNTMVIDRYYNITSGFIAGYYRTIIQHTVQALDNEAYWFKDTNGDIRDPSGILVLSIWNGNGWGDNNQFEIIDNKSTQIDDNGNEVIYGTATLIDNSVQFFIVEE